MVKPELIKQYVEPGKVRLVWNDFAWIGEESRQAAQAARCAGRQGKFWEYHDNLYSHQRGENLGQFSADNLRRFAADVGVDRPAFDTCLRNGEDLPLIRERLTAGRNLGIRATPSFIIGGRISAGAPTIDGLSRIIEAELARQGAGAR